MRSRTQVRRFLPAAAALAVVALIATGCASGDTAAAEPAESETASAATSVTFEDNSGEHTLELPLTSVVALDNRTFETLSDWGIELSAAAVSLMPSTVAYKDDADLVDIGNHREPNLELIVAADPQLVISGQRFTQFDADIAALVPDAAVINLDPRDGEDFADELKRQTTVLGEIFGKQKEAATLVEDLDKAIKRVTDAYDADQTVMAVNTSGGEIGYIAPGVGRTLGPIFDVAGLTPALEVAEGTDDHQGDDISVEAIATANPDWILVMDRDAAVSADDPAFVPAAEILEKSEALSKVTAVTEGNIVYMPADTYTNEGIQTYTEFLNDFADALEGK